MEKDAEIIKDAVGVKTPKEKAEVDKMGKCNKCEKKIKFNGGNTLSIDERYTVGTKLISLVKEITGAKRLGVVQKLSVTAEVNEHVTVELKFFM